MNLRDLEYLVALSELKHFRKAAEKCFVSQPTLSGQIKKLETLLDVQLLERTTRNVFLTPIGEEIVKRSKVILSDVKSIENSSNDEGQGYNNTQYRRPSFETSCPRMFNSDSCSSSSEDDSSYIPSGRYKLYPNITFKLLSNSNLV